MIVNLVEKKNVLFQQQHPLWTWSSGLGVLWHWRPTQTSVIHPASFCRIDPERYHKTLLGRQHPFLSSRRTTWDGARWHSENDEDIPVRVDPDKYRSEDSEKLATYLNRHWLVVLTKLVESCLRDKRSNRPSRLSPPRAGRQSHTHPNLFEESQKLLTGRWVEIQSV